MSTEREKRGRRGCTNYTITGKRAIVPDCVAPHLESTTNYSGLHRGEVKRKKRGQFLCERGISDIELNVPYLHRLRLKAWLYRAHLKEAVIWIIIWAMTSFPDEGLFFQLLLCISRLLSPSRVCHIYSSCFCSWLRLLLSTNFHSRFVVFQLIQEIEWD